MNKLLSLIIGLSLIFVGLVTALVSALCVSATQLSLVVTLIMGVALCFFGCVITYLVLSDNMGAENES